MTKQQQTRLATLIGHEASLLLPFVLLISTFAAALVLSAVGPHPPHPPNVPGLSFQVEFPLEVSGGGWKERWDACYQRLT